MWNNDSCSKFAMILFFIALSAGNLSLTYTHDLFILSHFITPSTFLHWIEIIPQFLIKIDLKPHANFIEMRSKRYKKELFEI